MSSTAPYEVMKSEVGDYYIILTSANLTLQNGLSKQEANRIADLMNGRAVENLAKAEQIKAAALESKSNRLSLPIIAV